MMAQHVVPHALDHAAVGDLQSSKFSHDTFILLSFLCLELRNPVLRQKLDQELIYFNVMNDVSLHFNCIDLA